MVWNSLLQNRHEHQRFARFAQPTTLPGGPIEECFDKAAGESP
jgi:hypothetical protein